MDERLPCVLNQKQAAAYVKMHPMTFKKLATDLPAIREGRVIRYSSKVLDEWLTNSYNGIPPQD
jgi:hypothetical protein